MFMPWLMLVIGTRLSMNYSLYSWLRCAVLCIILLSSFIKLLPYVARLSFLRVSIDDIKY